MRILVGLPDEGEAAHLAGLLRAAGHEVRAARDEVVLCASLAEQPPDLAVLGAAAPNEGVLGLVRKTSAATSHPHVLFLHSGIDEDFLAQAFEAGVDADLPRPLSPRYFLTRVAAIQRRLHPSDLAAPEALAPLSTPIDRVARSAVWTSVLSRLEGAAARFLTMNVSRSELPAEFVPEGLGASIVLLSAATQLEVRISIAVDAASAEGLAVHLFGAGDQELAQEVLNELSNIFMGTLKTALSGESHPFTGGLPEIISVDAVLRPAMPFRFQESSMFMAGDARLVVFAGLRSRANVLVFPPQLREGMVLAKDVVNARGVLLLQASTRLSSTMVERLQGNLTSRHEIEVIAP